jgi:DNA-binding protein Fis
MKNYWQPSIDNWIINENDASAYGSNMNSGYAADKLAGGASSSFTGGIPLKNEEEEEFDKLKQPYKGIKTLKALREQINQILEDAFNLSKMDKENSSSENPYEKILHILENPDLKTMLEMASDEIKNKSISSF